jgi:hypothetical protein
MFNILTKYSIPQFIKDLLKKRFAGLPLKQEVNESDDKLNFACPFCGDSEKDHRKKRGNFYFATNSYKCYNDGCGIKTDLTGIIQKFAIKYSLSIPDTIIKSPEFVHKAAPKRKGSLIEIFISKGIGKHLLKLDDIVKRFSLIPCKDAPLDSPIWEFVQYRQITKLPLFEQSCYYDSREDKIYLFNLDARSNRILGFSARKIIETDGPKYLIKNYSEFKKTGLISKKLSDDIIIDIDTLNNYYNVMNVNFSKPIIITEGQIDAMFLRNSMASTGVTKINLLLDNILTKENALVFFDNDKAGRNQSITLIKKGYRVFMWSKLMSDLRLLYPTDWLKGIKKIKDVNDLFVFMSSKKPEIGFDEFNDWIINYFSETEFDIFFT